MQKATIFEKRNTKLVAVQETIAVERRIIISWEDGQQILETTTSPGLEKELAIGLLCTMGITVPTEAVHYEHIDEITTIMVEQMKIYDRERNQTMGFAISPQEIDEGVSLLEESQVLLKETGCAHGALIWEHNRGRYVFAEDIRRQNALLKTIGAASIRGMDLSQCVMYFTGRLTSEVVAMNKQVRIPAIVSLAVTTTVAIEIAQEANITLIGSAGRWLYNIGAVKIVTK